MEYGIHNTKLYTINGRNQLGFFYNSPHFSCDVVQIKTTIHFLIKHIILANKKYMHFLLTIFIFFFPSQAQAQKKKTNCCPRIYRYRCRRSHFRKTERSVPYYFCKSTLSGQLFDHDKGKHA